MSGERLPQNSASADFGLREGWDAYWFLFNQYPEKYAARPEEELVAHAIDIARTLHPDPDSLEQEIVIEEAEQALLDRLKEIRAEGEAR